MQQGRREKDGSVEAFQKWSIVIASACGAVFWAMFGWLCLSGESIESPSVVKLIDALPGDRTMVGWLSSLGAVICVAIFALKLKRILRAEG